MLRRPIHLRTTALIILSLLFLSVAASSRSTEDEKVTLEDLIAKHLESIGSQQARGSVKTRIIAGASQVIFRTSPSGQAVGKAVLASEGAKNLLGMSFPSPVYPREQLGFNGS